MGSMLLLLGAGGGGGSCPTAPPSVPGPRCAAHTSSLGSQAQVSTAPPSRFPGQVRSHLAPRPRGPGSPLPLTRELWAGPTGRMGRTNLRWEPTAAGKGGAECVAAARLMRAIQELISFAVLRAEEAVRPQGDRVGPASLPPTSCGLHSLPDSQDPAPQKARSLATSRGG